MATANPSLFGMLGDEAAMQRQLDEQRAQAFAQQSQEQRLASMGYKAGSQLGRGIAGAFGVDVTDPVIRQASQLRQMASQFDTTSPEGLLQYAQAIRSVNPDLAMQAAGKAQEMLKEKSIVSKNLQEKKTNEERNAEALADASGAMRGTAEWNKTYAESLKGLTAKADTKTEFERILGSLDLSPEQEKAYKQQWVAAKLNPDPSGMKSLQSALVGLQVQQAQLKLETDQQKVKEEKVGAINKLSAAESAIEDSLATAEKALKLAPNSFVDASQQMLLKNIPWTDQKALNNLVSTLNSDKALGTLNELKNQSRTGATGFGALNTRELQLILDKTRSLDPTDKMFKENLTYVMNGWNKIRQQSQESRLDLQGKGEQLKTLKAKISAVRAKGSITADEKNEIEALKNELGVR